MPTMPTTIPAVLGTSAREFSVLRGADAEHAEHAARVAVSGASSAVRLSFVATPDGATVSNPAVTAFAKGLAVTVTAASRDRELNRAARNRARKVCDPIGAELAAALIGETR